MTAPDSDTLFAGSIPELYDTLLVPLIFAPYADDMALRVAARRPTRVLETAAGTGVLTRAMVRALPASTELIATDLNPPMLARAAAIGTARPVQWQQADAMQLPFADASVDLLVCQFGVMFFPDKAAGFAEARRVLRDGGVLLFNAWDRIAQNEFAHTVALALAGLFPDSPPQFMERTPHGYFDTGVIAADLASAGFTTNPDIDTVAARSRAPSAESVAMAYCQGTPWRNEILARGADLAHTTAACAAALAQRFGSGPIEAKIQAHVVSVRR